MKAEKRKKLEAAGWRVGSAGDLLGLTPEETAFVEVKLALSASLKRCRMSKGLSQSDLAKRLRSSQSRIAKIEASDPTVSLDLLIKALLVAGAKKKDIAKAIAESDRRPLNYGLNA
ncbi:MAG TPA: helix-turn-helix transcriptional regulator [Pyrinomonadaceae bacterium]|jgi:DNA-binding XRE family transcriptional regulator